MRALILEGRGGGWNPEQIRSAIHLGWTGGEVSFAHPGEESLLRVDHWHPDLIVIDATVTDWLSVIRGARSRSNSVIVALSATYDDCDLIEAVEAGADDYMEVPLNLPLFVARVRAALRRVRGDYLEDAVRCGELRVDPGRYEAQIEGHDLSLTSTEFKLLFELTRRNEFVVRKGPLCQALWGKEGNPEGAILRKYIQTLRRKLADVSPSTVNILTVPGVGYKLTSAPEREREPVPVHAR